MGYQILWLPWGGGLRGPPQEIKEGVISDPMLLYSICYLVFLGVTCKNQPKISKFEQDFRISKFCEMEISHHFDEQKSA